MTPSHVYIDVRTCDLTLAGLMEEIGRLQRAHPEEHICMDGELYAVVGREVRA